MQPSKRSACEAAKLRDRLLLDRMGVGEVAVGLLVQVVAILFAQRRGHGVVEASLQPGGHLPLLRADPLGRLDGLPIAGAARDSGE